MAMDQIQETITAALEEATGGTFSAASVTGTDNLLERGLTSHQIVQWMLGIEESLDVEFEDSQLNRETFASIESVRRAVEELLG